MEGRRILPMKEINGSRSVVVETSKIANKTYASSVKNSKGANIEGWTVAGRNERRR